MDGFLKIADNGCRYKTAILIIQFIHFSREYFKHEINLSVVFPADKQKTSGM